MDDDEKINIITSNTILFKERTVGGLILIHGRSIARMSMIKYTDDQKNEERINIQNQNIINQNKDDHHSKHHSYMHHNNSFIDITNTANLDVGFAQVIPQWGLIPFCISHLAKRVVDAQLHSTILCCLETVINTLKNYPPHSVNNKAGWSGQDEWRGNSQLRSYWIVLHTLYFAIMGRGLSNPFSI